MNFDVGFKLPLAAFYLYKTTKNIDPFTNLGSNGLVAVNRNKDPDLFTNEVSLQPHIYDIATKAYFLMRRLGSDESIIFCGPGNSGKSFSYR
ncbi:hypothetical protein CONCODRAFT_7982 [Conidiobolus coronatus NRRL 28638]|uniref:Uncharacterized protein n=1 Tax=Conidiobolus coronatus (strain ATCC 28846 / CBS 209.66 / NRRL 28638) TaxID=796925 RepID=A0A137P3Q6_CONC2|nr:hypothetical protein CONCODRAFT_7982 [Conidiobolus coronatus NRRL 28638]|eukprot:KXN69569.1 hypothetical protein CONCODRAFT_7982 [Conidiobolus coronatus NRRL 28638]